LFKSHKDSSWFFCFVLVKYFKVPAMLFDFPSTKKKHTHTHTWVKCLLV
jgi:hypothetical protein